MESARRNVVVAWAAALSLSAALAGCASDDGRQATASRLPPGQTCASMQTELARLDRKGVGQLAEAAHEGRKISAAQQDQIKLYNRLLSDYLTAQCHV